MFGDGIRLAGLDLLSRLQIREGMALCVSVMEPTRWGAGNRITRCVEYLQRYGAHAKAIVPQLQEIRAQLAGPAGKGGIKESLAKLDKAIAAIQSSTAAPTLVSLAEFKTRSGSGN